MDVAAIHEEITDVLVTHPGRVIQTIIQDQEIAGIDRRGAPFCEILGDLLGNELLALQDIGHYKRRILFVNEERGHDLTVELVGTLRA